MKAALVLVLFAAAVAVALFAFFPRETPEAKKERKSKERAPVKEPAPKDDGAPVKKSADLTIEMRRAQWATALETELKLNLTLEPAQEKAVLDALRVENDAWVEGAWRPFVEKWKAGKVSSEKDLFNADYDAFVKTITDATDARAREILKDAALLAIYGGWRKTYNQKRYYRFESDD